MKKARKLFLLVLVLLVLALFGKQVYQKLARALRGPAGKPARGPVAVRVAPVAKKTISETARFTGSILPQSRFVVAPRVAGRLEKLLVDVADTVTQGQLVALLDSQEYQEEVEAARAELEVAKANVLDCESSLEMAKRDLERTRLLREKKIASQAELDEVEANYKAREARYKVALAQVEQKRAALKAAEVRLSFTRIQATWEGGSKIRVVGERFVDVGSMLRANDGIISILDIDTVKVVLHVAEEDYYRLHRGQTVTFTTDSCADRKFVGRIVRIAPALKEEARAAQVEVTAANPGHLLKPGGFVRAEIELARHEQATVVPFSALTKRGEQPGVFLLEEKEKKVRFVPVETGIITEEEVEITRPALAGYVVTLGHHLLSDGSPVTLPEKESSGAATTGHGKSSRRQVAGGRP
ncbi:MAG TPA: efflux RND transporter periplasmic adaptor subunit [bacterium]|nr:efflux RND transporter periplasmic adaptor subunit [bacterium]